MSIISRVKANLDLRTLVSLEETSSHGEYISGRCPFHSDSKPSLLVYRDGWVCMASSCPKPHGSVLDWIAYSQYGLLNPSGTDICNIARDLDKGDFFLDIPIKKLPKKPIKQHHEISIEAALAYHRLLDDEALKYYQSRGFHQWFVNFNKWGWNGDSCVLPIWEDMPGKSEVLGFRYRSLHGETRYYGLRDYNQPLLFNKWIVTKAIEYQWPHLFVFYGEFDSGLAVQWGVPATSPTNGCKAFKPEWVENYKGEVFFVPDKGEEDAAYRDAEAVGLMGTVSLLPDDISGKDFTEQLQYSERYWDKKAYVDSVGITNAGLLYLLTNPDLKPVP